MHHFQQWASLRIMWVEGKHSNNLDVLTVYWSHPLLVSVIFHEVVYHLQSFSITSRHNINRSYNLAVQHILMAINSNEITADLDN